MKSLVNPSGAADVGAKTTVKALDWPGARSGSWMTPLLLKGRLTCIHVTLVGGVTVIPPRVSKPALTMVTWALTWLPRFRLTCT